MSNFTHPHFSVTPLREPFLSPLQLPGRVQPEALAMVAGPYTSV